MSGTLGAIAIASVSASRQAEGCGAGAACSAGLSASGACFSAAGFSVSAEGASAGRGLGNGTATRCTVPRSRGGLVPNRSPHGSWADLRAAAGSVDRQSNKAAATVTIAAPLRPKAPQGHLRLDFSTLKFMTIPSLTAKPHEFGGGAGP